MNNFWVKRLVNVVLDWVISWWILGPYPLMTDNLLSGIKTVEVVVNVMISTEVWNSIVDLVTKTLRLVFVLGATC
jgi:hypothetical protein